MIKLKELLRDVEITQFDIAKELDIKSLSTVNQKINNRSEFSVEAILLRDLITKRTSKKYSIEELFDEQIEKT